MRKDCTTLIRFTHGSQLFGTSLPTSDLDFKGVVVPPKRLILLGKYPKTSWNETTKEDGHAKNTQDDVDEEMLTFKGFMRLLEEGQTIALEALFVPEAYMIEMHPIWRNVVLSRRDQLVHKGVGAFFGYARQQAAKYGVKGSRVAAVRKTLDFLKTLDKGKKLGEYATTENSKLLDFVRPFTERPSVGAGTLVSVVECKGPQGKSEPHLEVCNRKIPFHATVKYAIGVFQRIFNNYGKRALDAERNENIDWKALSHAVRVGDQAIELLTTGKITLPRPNVGLLLHIKQGKIPYDDVAAMIETRLTEMTVLQGYSKLPLHLDTNKLDDLVERVHLMQVAGLL